MIFILWIVAFIVCDLFACLLMSLKLKTTIAEEIKEAPWWAHLIILAFPPAGLVMATI